MVLLQGSTLLQGCLACYLHLLLLMAWMVLLMLLLQLRQQGCWRRQLSRV
jgi:hypothetical protein